MIIQRHSTAVSNLSPAQPPAKAVTKIPYRIALVIGFLLLGPLYFFPVMTSGSQGNYMSEHPLLLVAVILPSLGLLINLILALATASPRLLLFRFTTVLLFLLMGLLLFAYLTERGYPKPQLTVVYFLPAFALLMNGMAEARWKQGSAQDAPVDTDAA